jgi:type IV pilus assembly protein PilM
MANSGAVWGIDVGQCALKALRCRPHEKDAGRIVIESFDYIEYPKILSQPEADREELVREALEEFLSRNEVKGDRVAISVAGQSGLTRFIKLPPVEKKKIPDIVKYEARQQIPFALEDVVWDYQPLVGTSEDDGYALDTEVGLFAMKRDQVSRFLQPFEEAGIDVEIVQLAPLSIYNYVCFDRFGNLATVTDGDGKTNDSVVVISLGTDTTDLVITNGNRVWQRNIPIGGSHFTKALSKGLRLTFAKAEHLKRNAMKAEDPKAVFQAMRPVFSDLVAEIQRSLGFFSSNNRDVRLGEVIVLGNAVKLPGLQRYLSQNLDQKVMPVNEFANLVGGSVAATQQFTENQLTFPVAYGLCVQALGQGQISTNLLPEHIVTTRIVRAKKPWIVAAAALLMIGLTINYATHYSAFKSVDIDPASAPTMAQAIRTSQSWSQQASSMASENSNLKSKFEEIVQIGQNLQSNVEGRLLWLELLKAIDAALPMDDRPEEEQEQTAEDVTSRTEIHIEHMECEYFEDLSQWFAGVQPLYNQSRTELVDQTGESSAGENSEGGDQGEAQVAGDSHESEENISANNNHREDTSDINPGDGFGGNGIGGNGFGGGGFGGGGFGGGGFDSSGAGEGNEGAESVGGLSGPGWVIQLNGYHFHNSDPYNEGQPFLQNTFIKQLEEGSVQLPDGPNGELVDVPIADLGISHPVVVTQNKIYDVIYDPEAISEQGSGQRYPMSQLPGSPRRGLGNQDDEEVKEPVRWKLREYDFVIQFAWSQKSRSIRQGESNSEAGPDEFDTTAANSRGR